MTMLHLAGPAAETAFRLEKLLELLHSRVEAVTDVCAHYEHYVHIERGLEAREFKVLQSILTYGTDEIPRLKGLRLHVVPRVGTISPGHRRPLILRIFALYRCAALSVAKFSKLRPTESCLLRSSKKSSRAA